MEAIMVLVHSAKDGGALRCVCVCVFPSRTGDGFRSERPTCHLPRPSWGDHGESGLGFLRDY